MTRQDPESVWVVIGGFGAMALGVALIPFRTLTAASNLAFVFLILTIVVAELGGRGAGLATAVVSALSLNFFLTEPYLTLTIDRPDDIVAFVALAVSGVVAAAFGRRRARSVELVSRARHDLEALTRTADALVTSAPLDTVLEDLRRAFRLGGIVLRDADERLICAAPPGSADRSAPALELEPRTPSAPTSGGTAWAATASDCPRGVAGFGSAPDRRRCGSTSGKATRTGSAWTSAARWPWRSRCSG